MENKCYLPPPSSSLWSFASFWKSGDTYVPSVSAPHDDNDDCTPKPVSESSDKDKRSESDFEDAPKVAPKPAKSYHSSDEGKVAPKPTRSYKSAKKGRVPPKPASNYNPKPFGIPANVLIALLFAYEVKQN